MATAGDGERGWPRGMRMRHRARLYVEIRGSGARRRRPRTAATMLDHVGILRREAL